MFIQPKRYGIYLWDQFGVLIVFTTYFLCEVSLDSFRGLIIMILEIFTEYNMIHTIDTYALITATTWASNCHNMGLTRNDLATPRRMTRSMRNHLWPRRTIVRVVGNNPLCCAAEKCRRWNGKHVPTWGERGAPEIKDVAYQKLGFWLKCPIVVSLVPLLKYCLNYFSSSEYSNWRYYWPIVANLELLSRILPAWKTYTLCTKGWPHCKAPHESVYTSKSV